MVLRYVLSFLAYLLIAIEVFVNAPMNHVFPFSLIKTRILTKDDIVGYGLLISFAVSCILTYLYQLPIYISVPTLALFYVALTMERKRRSEVMKEILTKERVPSPSLA